MKKMVVQFEDGEVEYTITAKTNIEYDGKTTEEVQDGAELTAHNLLRTAIDLYNDYINGCSGYTPSSFDTFMGLN